MTEFFQPTADVFMLLSGCVITQLILLKKESYGRYLWRRGCRILPAYWIALTLGIWLSGVVIDDFRHLPDTPEARFYIGLLQLGSMRLTLDSLLHAALLQGLAPSSLFPLEAFTLLGVAWSLSTEWQFYLIAPTIVRLATANKLAFIAIGLTCLIAATASSYLIHVFSIAFLPAKALFFFVGAISFVCVIRNRDDVSAFLWLLTSSGGLALGWSIGSGKPSLSTGSAIVWFLVLLSIRFQKPRFIGEFLRSALMRYLGRISYGTFLFHGAAITIVQAAIWRWVHPTTPGTLILISLPASAVVTLIAAALSWQFIERPFQRIGREHFMGSQTAYTQKRRSS
jgi:peptidoglycan/LPS O-acetylase OafA/YrhL